jgi:hypothetical protein
MFISRSRSPVHRGFRRTHQIGWRQARNLLGAIHYADIKLVELGRPLNTFVTINFGHIACLPERQHKFRKATRQSLRKVAAVRNIGIVLLRLGHRELRRPYAHSLGPSPPKIVASAIRSKLREWLARVAGTIACRESAINIKPVTNLRGLGLYLLKGMDPRYAPRCGVKHIPQGLVYGKRCGISKTLGPASRTRLRLGARSGFNPAPTLRFT